jgi:hypothetical protein
MKKRFFLFFLFASPVLHAQELFPHNEPASTVPKNVLGIRAFDETYDELGMQRNMAALRLMYGVTPKFTLMVTGTVSNHHSEHLPLNLVYHTHPSAGQTSYQTGTFPRGLYYPYRFNGIYVYGKYRFYTSDGQNRHFRMAAYGEWSYITSAHDETEPNLLDDTKGYGAGFITTFLKKHFAASLTAGFIIPGNYSETVPDFFGGEQHTRLEYGRAVIYNLSFGYLVYPFAYKSYKETNISVYLEFMGKSYETATVIQNDKNIIPQTDLLLAGHYVDAHPGLQFVIHSNLRFDFAVGFPVINKSYAHFYPVYMVGVQRYFFF